MIDVQSDHCKPIQHLMPHYTDSRFKQPQTVYLADGHRVGKDDYVKGAEYNYSDRLMEWNGWEKYEAAWNAAKASSHEPRSAAYVELYLRTLLDKPNLKLVHVMAGVNWGNGYPYQVYGYITGE